MSMSVYHQNTGNQSVGYNNIAGVYATAPYKVSIHFNCF